MFITSPYNDSLVFIKSSNINVFPCSRRRSTLVDGSSGSILDKHYIPFDPEARLNTEANNRKHSGLNGFKQSYIYDWNETTGKLSIVLAGYLFDINLGDNFKTPATLGAQMDELFDVGDSYTIYAKIMTGYTQFFSGGAGVPAASTKVLRHQTAADTIPNSLDMLLDGTNEQDINCYYFTGLTLTHERQLSNSENIVYLPLIKKDNGTWQVCESSKLPNIDHGSSANSISVGTLVAESIELASGGALASLVIGTNASTGKKQLQFTTKTT
jgi:hypothetical protein